MQKVIQFGDAKVTVNAPLFGDVGIDVECRNLVRKDLTLAQFAKLIYPAIDKEAKACEASPAEGAR